jgi:transcriptional regulator with GAF, ATPase, and Fis domain
MCAEQLQDHSHDTDRALLQLHEISGKLLGETDVRSLLNDILDAAISIMAADKGNIQLLDPVTGALRIHAYRGFSRRFLEFFNEVHEGKGASCGAAKQQARRMVVSDIQNSPIFSETPSLGVMLADGIRAVQSTPLFSRSGELFGMLNTHFGKPYHPTDRQFRFLDLLARQAADAIERAQRESALRQSEAWLAGQKEAFQAAINGAPLEVSLGVLVRTAVEYTGGEARAAFYAINPDGGTLRHLVVPRAGYRWTYSWHSRAIFPRAARADNAGP